MNITEIKDLALSLADREDSDLPSRLDAFLTLFEARMNRVLTAQDMEATISLPWGSDVITTYAITFDVRGIRSVKSAAIGGNTVDEYDLCNQEQFTNFRNNKSDRSVYTLTGNSIEIYPNINSTQVLRVIATLALNSITNTNPTNWLAIKHPDIYVMGLLAEIQHFAKNVTGYDAYWKRINDAVVEITTADERTKWGGNPLQTKQG